ncbi:proton myo-inositol cotransporter [Octopus sinensis]|uniref:Proton myo-inositol cotransporter n=1 Tax=Octopus sinensis TaxID=2607531 RepID=A0A6P7U4Y7_9MOLL|nr:proton myo-inositol cotransporter [Octopus sinensis]
MDPPVNPPSDVSFEHRSNDRYTPKENSKKFVLVLTVFSAIGGFLFGYDTGVVSGALLLLKREFNLTVLEQEIFVSVTIACACLFSLFGGYLNDKVGRRWTTIIASVAFTVGALLLGLANGITLLMIGRAFLGFGIGLASTTVPIYIAECAPVSIRGQLVTLNNFFITGGQFVASVMDGLFSCVPEGWRYMLGLAGIPAVIQMIGFIFLPESPRWLISKGRHEEASKVLKNIRATDDIHEEFTNIKESVESNPVHGSLIYNLKRIFQSKTVRRALVVGCGLQLFQQLCGINTVMYYSASIIKMAGVREESKAIWYASLTAAVNFLAGFSGLWLIERFGRRKLAIGSLTGVFFSLTILAIGFQLSAINSPKNLNQTNLENDHCSYSTCDTCIVDDDCGFAYTDNGQTVKFGYCLPKGNSSDDSDICSTETNSTANHEIFALDFCPSDYSWSAILGLVLYLMSFSPGMGPLPWTINSEIYPQWARGTCNSMATSVNWICNLLVSMTFLTLTDTITKYGTYWLFAFITGMGIIFVFTSLPETKGLPLEEVESLFNSPICSCGKKKNYKDIDNEK